MNLFLFYDFETNGIQPDTCAAMQLAIMNFNGEFVFNEYIYPYDNNIAGVEIHGIDEAKLIQNNANSYNIVFNNLYGYFMNNRDKEKIYMIAYNNFGYDQIVMEAHFERMGMKVPNNVIFVDLYPYIKEICPNIKPNYKLQTVFENLIVPKEEVLYHCAKADTYCLYKIYHKLMGVNNMNILLTKYGRPALSNRDILKCEVSVLNGYTPKVNYKRLGIQNVKTLYDKYVQFNNDELMLNYMKNGLKIFSDYNNMNMIRQLKYIQKFI